MKEFYYEKQILDNTISIIKNVLTAEEKDLDNLYNNYKENQEELWEYANQKEIHVHNLKFSLEKPYFARIDFILNNENQKKSYYIGKNGVYSDNELIVTDWRAPISSLYYDSEIGKCAFEAPDGIMSGNLVLKRQFEIEEGCLLKYFDVDLVSNDNLLQKYLNSNNDARLKSIVSTIQKEQNEVIRKKISNNLIIQGVAGSGKTTVALHRIAYLVYNNKNTINQNQYLIIGPNPVFIKYIKSVLPDLDVSGVKQCTFEQFSLNYINEKLNIIASDKKIAANIDGKINNDIDKFKCSIKYKNMLDQFLNYYFSSLTSEDLKVGDFIIFDKNIIKKTFLKYNENANSGDLKSIINQTIENLCNIISQHNEHIILQFTNYYSNVYMNVKDNEKENLKKNISQYRNEIKSNCRNIIRKYFSNAKCSSSKLYKLFVNSIEQFDIYEYNNIITLKKETLNNIKYNNYDFEDLSALIYIKNKINSDKNHSKIKHIVLDEAQDFGEFNFYILRLIFPYATFSIFGDLAQSIYDYRGIGSWDEVNSVMFEKNGTIINFNKSYRTTAQIMNIADEVAVSIGLNRSDLVVRQGEPVNFNKLNSVNDIPNHILNKIEEYKSKNYRTIAIISKTDLLSSKINKDLANLGLIIPNVTIDSDLTDDKYNICTISNQLSKGLEFDAVIISNSDKNIYSSNNSLDMKLLYVAITRALHELDIVYTGEITEPLKLMI